MTLVRMVSDDAKASIVKSLEAHGAIIKEIYDYKVSNSIILKYQSIILTAIVGL